MTRVGPTFSVVVPVYNEEAGLQVFHTRLAAAMDALGAPWEAVYVNDGSLDASLSMMQWLRATHPQVALLNLSRNFGKEIAITAGLDHARGQAVIVIDADLQDPPEIIPALVAAWRAGSDMVYAQRRKREGETWLKRTTATLFYRLMRYTGRVALPHDTGDFRLMSRRVVDAVLQMREQHRFMKGMFAWVGYPSVAIQYDRAPRHAGSTKWTYWTLWNLALEGITSFTVMPLKVATYLGLLVAICALIYFAYIVGLTLIYGNPVAGYPSLLAVILLLGAVQMITLGVIGEYLGRIFNETKARPLYFAESFVAPRAEIEAPVSRPHAATPVASATDKPAEQQNGGSGG